MTVFKPTEILRQALTDTDKAVIPGLEKLSITCKKGCNDCCSLLSLMHPLEAVNIAEFILQDPRVELTIPALLKDLIENAKQVDYEGITHANYFDKKMKCPLLKDGLCSVYDRRPVSCRYHFVISDPKRCSPDDENGQTLKVDLFHVESLVWDLCKELTGEEVAAPISIMLVWAFNALIKNGHFNQLSDSTKKLITDAVSEITSPNNWLAKYQDSLKKEKQFTARFEVEHS